MAIYKTGGGEARTTERLLALLDPPRPLNAALQAALDEYARGPPNGGQRWG
jgi:hypothetical protein